MTAGITLPAGAAFAAPTEVTLTNWASLINPAISGATVVHEGATYEITLPADTSYTVTGTIAVPADSIAIIDAGGDTLTRGESLAGAVLSASAGRSLTFQNGVIDGAGVSATAALITASSANSLVVGADGVSTVLKNGNRSTTGAAVYAASTPVEITDATFTGNQTGVSGGAVAVAEQSTTNTVSITDSTFTDNFATTNGGAIFVTGAPGDATHPGLTLTDVKVENNKAGNSGAGVYSQASTKIAGTTTIDKNDAQLSGGGILISLPGNGSTAEIGTDAGAHVSISDNVAGNIGGGARVNLQSTSVTDNTALRIGAGTVIANNHAAVAGGLSTELGATGPVSIDGTTFAGNTTTTWGSAIRVLSVTDPQPIEISNSTFSRNIAGTDDVKASSGTISIAYTLLPSLTVSKSTFTGNSTSRAPFTETLSPEAAATYAANITGSTTDNEGPSNGVLYNYADIEFQQIEVNPSNGTHVSGTSPRVESDVVVLGPDGTPLTDADGVAVTATSDADGAFSVTIPNTLHLSGAPYTPLDGDRWTVVAWDPTANDGAGGLFVSAVSPGNITIDMVAPKVPGDTVSNGSTVSGAGEPGATVTVTDKDGNSVGSGTVDKDGNFTVRVIPAAGDGDALSVTLTDPAGNVSDPVLVTVDTTAPDAPTGLTTDGANVSGTGEPGATVTVRDKDGNTVGTGTVGDDGKFTVTVSPAASDGDALQVTLTDPSGNASEPGRIIVDTAAPDAPGSLTSNGSKVTGAGEPGGTVTVKDKDGNTVGTGTVGDDGKFTVEVSPVASDGDALTVTVTDPAGNTSEPGTVTVDTVAPDAPSGATSNGSTVVGKGEPGATVTVKDEDGNVVGTGTVDKDGNFTVPVNPAAKDGDSLGITLTDPAGNESKPTEVTVDAVAPDAPSEVTSNGSTVTGKGEPGSTVTVTDKDGNTVGTGTVGDDGKFTVPVRPAASDGDELTVNLTDPAGNESKPTEVMVDAVAPDVPSGLSSNGTTVTGKGEPGATVTVTDEDGNTVGSGTVDKDGNFTVPVSPAGNDGDKLTVTSTDPAGNTSEPGAVTVDKTAPGAATGLSTNGSTVTGKGEPGATIVVKDKNGKVVGKGTVSKDGNFTVAVSPAAKPGDSLGVTLTDAAGNTSKSATVKVPANAAPMWIRLSGADRYDTAVAIAKNAYPTGAGTVFVATGENFPDALAAGPVAVAKKAPLLLTQQNRVPSNTLAEIRALRPTTVVIVGGDNAVSPAVANQLKGLSTVKTVTRIGGADRFQTSRLLADYGFKGGASKAFIVTGANYPDAVSVSAPAGAQGAPILLVNGSAAASDSATRAELSKLKVTKTYIAGGTAVVSQGIQRTLPNATRLAGADRWGTNLAVAKAFYPKHADNIYVATGANFPDALVGGVLAGQNPGPLLLVNTGAWPKATLAYVKPLGFTKGHLLGGTTVLSDTLKKLNTSF